MKVICCLFLIAGVTSTLAVSPNAEISNDVLLKEGETLTATFNDYVDLLMHNLDKMVIKAGLDPMAVPDMDLTISKKILITYWGQLKLTEIKVNDFSTIHRNDDAVVSYDKSTKKMKIDIPLEIKDIKFASHYKASLMGLGPHGKMDGKMKSIKMITSIEIDYSTYKAKVLKYKITHTDHITVHFHQSFLVNWLIDLLANTVTTVFKGLIVGTIDKVVEGTLDTTVTLINTAFEDIERLVEGNSTVLTTGPVMKNFGNFLTERKFNLS